MLGPTDPRSCAISFHLPGKKLPGGFYLILSWMPGAKSWVLKPRTFALSTLLYEHAKSAFWKAPLTPCVLNLRTNHPSIGISQPLASLTSR